MGRWRIVSRGLAVLGAIAAGCSTFGSTESIDTSDAGKDAPANTDASNITDAGDAGCTVFVDDFSSPEASASSWTVLANSTVGATDGSFPVFRDGFAQLTSYDFNEATGFVWSTKAPLDAFVAEFDLSSTYAVGETPSDTGLAFFALNSQTLVPCASAVTYAQQICVLGSGAPGFALAIVVARSGQFGSSIPLVVTATGDYPDAGYADADVALLATSVFATASQTPPDDTQPPTASSWHHFEVQALHGKLTIRVNGQPYLVDGQVEGYTPFTGFWGFAGATTSRTRNLLRKVTMKVGAACTP